MSQIRDIFEKVVDWVYDMDRGIIREWRMNLFRRKKTITVMYCKYDGKKRAKRYEVKLSKTRNVYRIAINQYEYIEVEVRL